MGRKPCCTKEGLNRGAWSLKEDEILSNYIELHGEGKWKILPQKSGLNRCGKSCRLRWMNYLRPGIKRGGISPEEEDLIIRLHRLLGNRWSLIAGRLPGRTDNEIKNYWNSVLSKKLKADVSKTKKTPDSEDHMKCLGNISATNPNLIVPKATRCTKILLSFDNHCPPSSTPTESYDGLMWVSPKDNDVLNMHNDLDYLDFSKTGIDGVFENNNMLENDELAPIFEMEFDNLTSLIELQDDWTDLL